MSEGVERTEGAEGTLPRVVCEGENLQQVWRGVFSTFSTLIFTIDKSLKKTNPNETGLRKEMSSFTSSFIAGPEMHMIWHFF